MADHHQPQEPCSAGNPFMTLEACMQELENTKQNTAWLQQQNELLREQLAVKDLLIAAKEEMLVLLRGGWGYNRLN